MRLELPLLQSLVVSLGVVVMCVIGLVLSGSLALSGLCFVRLHDDGIVDAVSALSALCMALACCS